MDSYRTHLTEEIAERIAGTVSSKGVTITDLCTIADALGVPVESLLIGDAR